MTARGDDRYFFNNKKISFTKYPWKFFSPIHSTTSPKHVSWITPYQSPYYIYISFTSSVKAALNIHRPQKVWNRYSGLTSHNTVLVLRLVFSKPLLIWLWIFVCYMFHILSVNFDPNMVLHWISAKTWYVVWIVHFHTSVSSPK